MPKCEYAPKNIRQFGVKWEILKKLVQFTPKNTFFEWNVFMFFGWFKKNRKVLSNCGENGTFILLCPMITTLTEVLKCVDSIHNLLVPLNYTQQRTRQQKLKNTNVSHKLFK